MASLSRILSVAGATGSVTLLLTTASPLVVPAFAASTPAQLCDKGAGDAMRSCLKSVGRAQQECYRATGSACADDDPAIVEELAAIETKLLERCPTQGVVEDTGYPAGMTPSVLADRIQDACLDFVASLAARSYAGPQAAALDGASDQERTCLDGAWKSGLSLGSFALRQQSSCIRKQRSGTPCDATKVVTKIAAREQSTGSKIAARCAVPLESLVAVPAPSFASRAVEQSHCLVAAAHAETAPLPLRCGPRAGVPVPARGVDTQVVLPYSVWGSRCGDGSDYAFRFRLAPTGSPAEKIVVHMEGGGYCADGPGCASRPADLFEAQSDPLPQNGMMSNTAATNPFRDWTKVSLPYCTQDLHIGGGVVNAFPEKTVHRYGARNVRAAMQYIRDVIWAVLDAEDPDGYRTHKPVVVFSGSSAGGYGSAYNYHWMLDDLRWVHTTSVPDAGLAMDNGTAEGVIGLATAALGSPTTGWGALPYLPPYCFAPECAEIFVNLELASVPRLLAQPEQQFLHVSNQIDNTQVQTTGFASRADFVNELRESYCSVRGTPGLHSFLRASSASVHGQLNNGNWDTAVIDGVALRDWVGGAMASPASVVDRTEEGTLVVDEPGVQPFPCALN